ncbi:type II toxin-antitoxin system RelE/ParE family toxin [endosymbiont GvMRE of Glomus versiforme]|nr:type II toxin-antitoxin system RelE/ParE family toxin [endosymbiont GvMRE of Glomus versiforme]RHZ36229.1 Plasmid maintenance system killer [endosymbiont GvMRE of Glomus versiforme]
MTTLFAFAANLNQLKTIFGTDLEKLKGRRQGQHSIRVNDQFRLCFIWETGKVYQVELVDYHKERK